MTICGHLGRLTHPVRLAGFRSEAELRRNDLSGRERLAQENAFRHALGCSFIFGRAGYVNHRNFRIQLSGSSSPAIKELEEEGLDRTPVPANFPQELEKQEVAYQFIDASDGLESQQGRWARGPSVDGKGQFTYAKIEALTDDEGLVGQVDPRTYGTPASPVPAQAAE